MRPIHIKDIFFVITRIVFFCYRSCSFSPSRLPTSLTSRYKHINIPPGSCPVQLQSDLLATEQLHWSSLEVQGVAQRHLSGGDEGGASAVRSWIGCIPKWTGQEVLFIQQWVSSLHVQIVHIEPVWSEMFRFTWTSVLRSRGHEDPRGYADMKSII